jgi:hypothetical protein
MNYAVEMASGGISQRTLQALEILRGINMQTH